MNSVKIPANQQIFIIEIDIPGQTSAMMLRTIKADGAQDPTSIADFPQYTQGSGLSASVKFNGVNQVESTHLIDDQHIDPAIDQYGSLYVPIRLV